MKLSAMMLATVLAAGQAAACPTRIPAGLKGSNVGDDLVVNGLTMSVVQVEGTAPPAAVLAQTERDWKAAGYKVKRNNAAGWDILSALGDKCMVTLQLVARNGAFGYLSINTKPTAAARTPQSAGMPLPADATILSTVASSDSERPGLTVALTTAMPMDKLSRYFYERLEQDHWGAIRTRKMVAPVSGNASLMMSAQRARDQIDITVWPDKQTQVVMTVSPSL